MIKPVMEENSDNETGSMEVTDLSNQRQVVVMNGTASNKSLFLSRLPDDLIACVLSYLPFKEKIKLSRVNQRFGVVVDSLVNQMSAFSYRSFSYHRVNSAPDEGHLMEGRLRILSKMSKLKSFEVPDVVEFRLPALLAEYCPRIEEIRCRSLQLVYDYCITLLKNHNKIHLKMIHLTTTDALDAELLVRILLLSSEIDVSTSSQSITPTLTKYENYFKSNPHSLALIYQRVTRMAVGAVLYMRSINLPNFSRLVSLDMVTNIDRDIISSSISKLLHLKELTIKTDIENFDLLSTFQSDLEKLHFTDTLNSKTANSSYIFSFLSNRGQKLQELTIICKKMRGHPDQDLLLLLKDCCPNLHSIHIHNFNFLRLEYCPLSRKLVISKINLESLEILFDMFPKTRTFDLEGKQIDWSNVWIPQLKAYANQRRSQAIIVHLRFSNGKNVIRQHDKVNLDVTVYRPST